MLEENKRCVERFLKDICGVKEVEFCIVDNVDFAGIMDTISNAVKHDLELGHKFFFDLTGGESLPLVAFGIISKELMAPMHMYDIKSNEMYEYGYEGSSLLSELAEYDSISLNLDGFQRIMTVYDYVKRGIFGGDGKSFSLSNSDIINARWRGRTFLELQPEEQRKIRNFPIHAIIFEQKESKDDTGMYQIFERINTSGRSLKPQEIRNCVYHGDFNKLLLELNKYGNWRKFIKVLMKIPECQMLN